MESLFNYLLKKITIKQFYLFYCLYCIYCIQGFPICGSDILFAWGCNIRVALTCICFVIKFIRVETRATSFSIFSLHNPFCFCKDSLNLTLDPPSPFLYFLFNRDQIVHKDTSDCLADIITVLQRSDIRYQTSQIS